MVPIDFNSIIFPTIEVDGDQQLFFRILQNIFCVQHKKETGFGRTLPLTILVEIIYLVETVKLPVEFW